VKVVSLPVIDGVTSLLILLRVILVWALAGVVSLSVIVAVVSPLVILGIVVVLALV